MGRSLGMQLDLEHADIGEGRMKGGRCPRQSGYSEIDGLPGFSQCRVDREPFDEGPIELLRKATFSLGRRFRTEWRSRQVFPVDQTLRGNGEGAVEDVRTLASDKRHQPKRLMIMEQDAERLPIERGPPAIGIFQHQGPVIETGVEAAVTNEMHDVVLISSQRLLQPGKSWTLQAHQFHGAVTDVPFQRIAEVVPLALHVQGFIVRRTRQDDQHPKRQEDGEGQNRAGQIRIPKQGGSV